MSIEVNNLKEQLKKYIDKDKAEFLPRFFKVAPGEYGEGDVFIGVTVPNQRKVARNFKKLSFDDIESLLKEEVHEYRLTALLILVHQFEKSKEDNKKALINFYLENADRVNNWDLVDSTAHKILGPYLINKDRKILYKLAKEDHLWKQRIAIMTTFHFIKNNDYKDALAISEILINHNHDLIHKAVGWMLREIGKRDKEVEVEYLNKYYKQMPRTMLRYAIEKFPNEERQNYLKGIV